MEHQEEPPLLTIQDLYFELSRIYSCKYADKEEESDRCLQLLFEAVHKRGVNPQFIIKKMKQLKTRLRLAGDFESKLSAQIQSRFWEKDYADQEIPYRPFRPA
jgi:hypothetical protein